jgi:hypothetical protein
MSPLLRHMPVLALLISRSLCVFILLMINLTTATGPSLLAGVYGLDGATGHY